MAERITITPSELYTAASNFNAKAGEIASILQYLKQQVDELESTWDGAAQDEFFALYGTLAPQLMQMAEQVLPGIAQTLTGVAESLERADEEIAGQLRGQ